MKMIIKYLEQKASFKIVTSFTLVYRVGQRFEFYPNIKINKM